MYIEQTSIKSWAEEDRPREKLLSTGKTYLSNAELLAIILGAGSKNESALGLSKKILQHYDNSLLALGKANVDELSTFKGIGPAKAVSIVATLELARRKNTLTTKKKPQITSSNDAYKLVKHLYEDQHVECFYILLLNQNNRLIHTSLISQGGIAATVVDPKIIFKEALDKRAVSIILSHNHPSGNLKPSQADIDITKKIKAAGHMLDIKTLDHLIIADQSYFSFADEGIL